MRGQLEGKRPPTDTVLMELLSKEYGWTPNQMREMKLSDIHCYSRIISMRNKIEERRAKQTKKR